jgi:hypothetical protein
MVDRWQFVADRQGVLILESRFLGIRRRFCIRGRLVHGNVISSGYLHSPFLDIISLCIPLLAERGLIVDKPFLTMDKRVGIVSDLLITSLGRVNWYEIAENNL